MVGRGAIAGCVAAAVWAAVEPGLGRALRTPYSDVRLLGRAATRGPFWPLAGLVLHLGNGAAFGSVWARLDGRGVLQGILAAEAENLALWPGMALADRFHPDRKSGAWPPLLLNKRVFAYEATVHAVFGVTLGLLARR